MILDVYGDFLADPEVHIYWPDNSGIDLCGTHKLVHLGYFDTVDDFHNRYPYKSICEKCYLLYLMRELSE